jgi:hypothetical protein
VFRECLPQGTPVLGQGLRVSLRADLLEQPRRSLDVGEEQRDGPREQRAHAA